MKKVSLLIQLIVGSVKVSRAQGAVCALSILAFGCQVDQAVSQNSATPNRSISATSNVQVSADTAGPSTNSAQTPANYGGGTTGGTGISYETRCTASMQPFGPYGGSIDTKTAVKPFGNGSFLNASQKLGILEFEDMPIILSRGADGIFLTAYKNFETDSYGMLDVINNPKLAMTKLETSDIAGALNSGFRINLIAPNASGNMTSYQIKCE